MYSTGEFYPSGCNNGIKAVRSFGEVPCPRIVGGLLPIKNVRFSKSPAILNVDSKREWIVMTLSKSHIAKLRLVIWVFNYEYHGL